MRLVSRRVVVCTAVGLVVAGTWAAGVGLARQKAAASMATAANAFLATLTPEQRQKATYPLVSEEWTRWHFVPTTQFPRNGLPFGEMTDVQRKSAHDLMRVSLSQAGYATATTIIRLEDPLKAIEAEAAAARAKAEGAAAAGGAPAAPGATQGAARRGGGRGTPMVRDPNLYYFTVFGTPSGKAGWGWRVEGHHLSLRFAVDNGKMHVTSTPQFLGANPATVPQGYPMAGTRVLAAQEDLGRTLVLALDAKQQAVALVAATPRNDIQSATAIKVDPLQPVGLPATDMTPAQRGMLMRIVESYSSVMPADIAADRLAKIKTAGPDKLTFAWAGSTEKGQRYHYQVQGPTFVIEHNNTQNNGNHIHSVWRDFNGDFGRDLLAEHMAAVAH